MDRQPEVRAQDPAKNPKLSGSRLSDNDNADASTKPRLPLEIQLLIVQHLVVPYQPCVPHHVCKCSTPWTCKRLSGLNHWQRDSAIENLKKPLLVPPFIALSINKTWRHEALRYFFKYNTFVFDTSPYMMLQPKDRANWGWTELRDPFATRLLDFVDKPEWKNEGSELWRLNEADYCPQMAWVDDYRYTIRKLAIMYIPHIERAASSPRESDWNWPLAVDWKTLPNLEELWLDMRGMGDLERWMYTDTLLRSLMTDTESNLNTMFNGMQCLRLRKLVLMNVSFGAETTVEKIELGKELITALCKSSLREGAEFEIWMDDSWRW